jgi:hypothetical protein
MPRKSPRVIFAAIRTAEARRIVAAQRDLIERLAAAEDPAVADAERALSTYESALRHLEDHERKIRMERKARLSETKKSKI